MPCSGDKIRTRSSGTPTGPESFSSGFALSPNTSSFRTSLCNPYMDVAITTEKLIMAKIADHCHETALQWRWSFHNALRVRKKSHLCIKGALSSQHLEGW